MAEWFLLRIRPQQDTCVLDIHKCSKALQKGALGRSVPHLPFFLRRVLAGYEKKKNIAMSKILCTGLFLLFCALAAESLRCKMCFRVRRHVPCKTTAVCVAKPGQFCLKVQLKFQGHFHMEIRNCTVRGTRDCEPRIDHAKSDLEIKRSCCRRNLCNR